MPRNHEKEQRRLVSRPAWVLISWPRGYLSNRKKDLGDEPVERKRLDNDDLKDVRRLDFNEEGDPNFYDDTPWWLV